jgi:hypothetical protein
VPIQGFSNGGGHVGREAVQRDGGRLRAVELGAGHEFNLSYIVPYMTSIYPKRKAVNG